MGNPGEPLDKGIDATVGGLVWVRRRNGSWWPGQIIDMDECSESFMASMRAGTPIKLLGRDDASVDWYNLEKSKRVKPFRAVEFADCIEKARLAAANSAKKVVKYARRDDAILHALDIELEKLNGDTVKPVPSLSLSSKDSERTDDDISGFNGDNSSVEGLLEGPKKVMWSSVEQSVQARPQQTPNDSEDDGTEGVKRMRGLDDLGIGAVQAMKRKRSQVGHVYDFLKKKSRSRPLMKVLESTPMVPVPVVREKLPYPSEFVSDVSKGSSSVIVNNSDSVGVSCEHRTSGTAFGHASESVLVSCKHKENGTSGLSAIPEKASSGKLFDVPLVPKRPQPAGTTPNITCQKPQYGAGGRSSESSLVETLSLGNEEINESVSTSSGTTDIGSMARYFVKDNSKWQSKGKRKSRNIARSKKPDPRRSENIDDDFDVNLDEYWGRYGRGSRKAALPREATPDARLFTGSLLNTPRLLPYRQSRSIMNPKYGPDFSMTSHNDLESELYDVYLEVNASSRPQRVPVPFISLVSKLADQPVVGHPLAVEILEDGYADALVRRAKRILSSSSSERNLFVTEYEQTQNIRGGRVPLKQLKSHHVSPNNTTKLRKSALSSKKIRKLSSLTGLGRLSQGETNLVLENITGYAVACVPVKVAFSRINATLKGSMRPPKRVVKSRNL